MPRAAPRPEVVLARGGRPATKRVMRDAPMTQWAHDANGIADPTLRSRGGTPPLLPPFPRLRLEERWPVTTMTHGKQRARWHARRQALCIRPASEDGAKRLPTSDTERPGPFQSALAITSLSHKALTGQHLNTSGVGHKESCNRARANLARGRTLSHKDARCLRKGRQRYRTQSERCAKCPGPKARWWLRSGRKRR